jgi:hypothetical protein
MCQFKSGIVTKKDVLWLLDSESHEDIIKEFKLNDKTQSPDFVRVEMLPIDGNIFNHDLGNWKLKVDQDFKPEWFSEKEAQELMIKPLTTTFNERFVIGKNTLDEIKKGCWYVGDSATIKDVGESATINYVCGSATIKDVRDSATINYVRDSATINYVGDSATIKDVGDSATINIYSKLAKWKLTNSGIAIIRYDVIPKIIVADSNIKLELQK